MSPAMPAKQWNQASGGAEPVVDADNRDTGGAGGVHREQGGDTLEGGAVADAGRDGDHGGGREAGDQARERAFHAGHDDDGVGLGHLVEARQQPVHAGHAAVGQELRSPPKCLQSDQALLGHGDVGRAGGDDQYPSRPGLPRPPRQRGAMAQPTRVAPQRGVRLRVVGPGEQDGSPRLGEELGDDVGALLRRLARAVDRLGQALAERAVVVDPCVAQVGEGHPSQPSHRLVGAHGAGADILEELAEGGFVHVGHYPAWA
jgi:hypothetical protein